MLHPEIDHSIEHKYRFFALDKVVFHRLAEIWEHSLCDHSFDTVGAILACDGIHCRGTSDAVAVIKHRTYIHFVAKKLRVGEEKTNIEAIIGQKCVVTERIDNYAGCGQAKVNGQVWSARGCNDEDVFEVGEILRIVAIEGVKIICKR